MLTQADGKEIFINQLGKGNFLSPFIKFSVPGAGSSAFGSVNVLGSFESDVETKDFGGSFGAIYIGRKHKRQFQPDTQVTASFSSQTVLDRTPTNRGLQVQNNGDAGTWTPTDLGTSVCAAWFSADSLSSLSNGDAVTSWTSSEGNSVAATQGTAAKQPTYVQTSSVSGKPAVNFDGASDFDQLLFTKSTLNVGTSGSLMCLFIGNANDGSTLSFGGITRGSSSVTSIQLLYTNNNSFLQLSLGSTSKTSASSNFPAGTTGSAYRAIAFRRQDGKFALRYLGNELSDQAADSTDLSGTDYNIGSSYFSGGCEGEIAEIMFLVNPTLTQIKQVEGYAAHKYSLTSSLPANHPYKYNPPTKGNDFFVGGSSVSSSNGYKLSPGEKTPFINCQLSGINVVQSTGSCTASTISI